MQIELTPKGISFINYLKDKEEGKDVYIEAYEKEIEESNKFWINYFEDRLDKYLSKHKRAKLINVRLMSDIPFTEHKAGDIMQIYNIPIFNKPYIMISNKFHFSKPSFCWMVIENGIYTGHALYKGRFEKIK